MLALWRWANSKESVNVKSQGIHLPKEIQFTLLTKINRMDLSEDFNSKAKSSSLLISLKTEGKKEKMFDVCWTLINLYFITQNITSKSNFMTLNRVHD